ncbi:GTPase domain-containing protein [Nocardia sp. NRRL S-836]|uniref:GTPase domain-containing protein n=1 Tax=Nocardia sp. NRRL S-836 TaxID=1519492 RepID=UPI0006ADA4D5|nr:GTPase domain-containing protein [Nocardia sp. NRRL S-836]
MTLDRVVWSMLQEASAVYRDSPRATGWLRAQVERYTEPVRVAVAGRSGIGKSTVVNALIGDEFAPLDSSVWYRGGTQARAHVFSGPSRPHEVAVTRRNHRQHVEIDQVDRADRVVVEWPARTLRDVVLIDTPSSASPEQVLGDADALVYLMRHVQDDDLRFLQAAHDHPIARGAAVHTVAVLARADEIGAGRIDALSSAKQIARRYRKDVAVRPLCQNVVSVAGLLAVAGRTMREDEFAALRALSALGREELEDHLLSADRFAGEQFPLPMDPVVRQALLGRFGIFGVRLITALIRQGFDTQVKLTGQLVQRSGLGELRDSIAVHFTERREVLKARSALLALDVLFRMEPRQTARGLMADLERVVASAHDFRELRLVAALQSGRTKLPAELQAEAMRLVGAEGTNPLARLGFDYEADPREQREAVFDALARWQAQAADVHAPNEQRRAAQVVVRSCEGLLPQLP